MKKLCAIFGFALIVQLIALGGAVIDGTPAGAVTPEQSTTYDAGTVQDFSQAEILVPYGSSPTNAAAQVQWVLDQVGSGGSGTSTYARTAGTSTYAVAAGTASVAVLAPAYLRTNDPAFLAVAGLDRGPLTWYKYDNTIPAAANKNGLTTRGRLALGSGTNADEVVAAGTVIKIDDTYRCYYAAQDAAYAKCGIYLAMSSDKFNWVKVNNAAMARCNTGTPTSDGRIPMGITGSGDDAWLSHAWVLKFQGQWFCWYAGYDGAQTRIFCATSVNGLAWIKVNNANPAASNTGGTDGRIPLGSGAVGDQLTTYRPLVMIDDDAPADKRFVMFYTGCDGSLKYCIFRATSPDGLTWTKLNNAILAASDTVGTDGRLPLGTAGKGDDAALMCGSVWKEGTRWKMLYSGADTDTYGTYRLYSAWSYDGLTWYKQNNTAPANSDVYGTDGRLGLGSSGRGDDANVYNASILMEPSLGGQLEYTLFYGGGDGANTRTFMATALYTTNLNTAVPQYKSLLFGQSNQYDVGSQLLPAKAVYGKQVYKDGKSVLVAGDALTNRQVSVLLGTGFKAPGISVLTNKITDVSAGTSSNDAANVGQMQGYVGSQGFVTTSGTTAYSRTSGTATYVRVAATLRDDRYMIASGFGGAAWNTTYFWDGETESGYPIWQDITHSRDIKHNGDCWNMRLTSGGGAVQYYSANTTNTPDTVVWYVDEGDSPAGTVRQERYARSGSSLNVSFGNVTTPRLVQTAGGWDDLCAPANSVRVQGTTSVATDYTENSITFTTGSTTNFADDHVYFTVQFPHSYKTNSTIRPHLHFIQQNANHTNLWFMRYRWFNIGATIPATWSETFAASNEVTYSSGNLHQMAMFPPVSGSGKSISSLFDCKLYRRGSTGTGTIHFKQFDIHIQNDGLGSDGHSSKSF